MAHLTLTIGACSSAQHTWLAQLKIFMKGRKPTWAASRQNQQNDVRPAKTLISLGGCMKKVWVLSYPMSAQGRLWSDWAHAQADLFAGCTDHFVGFVMRRLIWKQNHFNNQLRVFVFSFSLSWYRSDLALQYFPMVYNSTCEDKRVWSQEFYHFVLLKTNYLDLWLQALQ